MKKGPMLPPRILNIPTLRHNLQRALESKEMKVPPNRLVLDLETTGLTPYDNFIWQVGLRAMINGAAQSERGEVFYLAYPPETLKKATFEINRRMACQQDMSDSAQTPDERVQAGQYYKAEQEFIDEVTHNGKDPKTVLQHVADVISTYVNAGWFLCGQNFTRFDLVWLDWHFKNYGIKCDLPHERLIDTGILIKAAQLNLIQLPHESCKTFYMRAANVRAKGVFYSLERFAVNYWGLTDKLKLDVSKEAHNAGFDAWLTDMILHELINEVLASEGVLH